MCNTCKELIPAECFYSPRDYMNYLEDIGDLVASGQYELEEATCPIEAVLDQNGRWASDVICHIIRCKQCGTRFQCFVNTSDRSGSFLIVE